jgi:hypothetical protein
MICMINKIKFDNFFLNFCSKCEGLFFTFFYFYMKQWIIILAVKIQNLLVEYRHIAACVPHA